MDKAPKKKMVSVNFCQDLFSLLDFFTLEDGTTRLSHNVSKELPLYCM
jgi:hypothetical protein